MLLNKNDKGRDVINLEDLGNADIFKIILRKLYSEGKYNEGENLIFEELERNSSLEIYKESVDFYTLLLEKTDEELESKDFPREEVLRGLSDIKKYIQII